MSSRRTPDNPILGSAEAITTEELAQRRIQLAEPVTARFQTDDTGSTGIELRVRLQDPSRIRAARAALARRFGGESRCDRLIVT
jgi:hypothetical protein